MQTRIEEIMAEVVTMGRRRRLMWLVDEAIREAWRRDRQRRLARQAARAERDGGSLPVGGRERRALIRARRVGSEANHV